MSLPKIRVVQMDDWCAIYLDGSLYHEGHSLRTDILIDALRKTGALDSIKYEQSYEDILDRHQGEGEVFFPNTESELNELLESLHRKEVEDVGKS